MNDVHKMQTQFDINFCWEHLP